MKNLKVYAHFQIDQFFNDIFKTKVFKDLCAAPGACQGIFDKLRQRPIITYEATSPIEKNHFTTWMGLIQLRHYENDYMNDLYYLHELAHWATMEYGKCKDLSEFHTKMAENELFAATLSEVYIYLEAIGLRQMVFDHPIWFDSVYNTMIEKEMDFNKIMKFRKKRISNPDSFNFCEMQIAKYASQNAKWTAIWAKNWREVEDRVAVYLSAYDDAASLRDGSIDEIRASAIDCLNVVEDYKGMILIEASKSKLAIPYEREAMIFNDVVEQMKKVAGNDLF